MNYKNLALFGILPLSAFAATTPSDPESFGLYGYGKGIGGLSLFHADGYAYLGDPGRSNISDATTVILSRNSNNTWTAAPNSTTPVPLDGNTFYIPGPDNSDSRVGFLPSNETSGNNSTQVTMGFTFYGSTASLEGNDGTLQSVWYANQVSDKVYSLHWNDTDAGLTSVILRSQAPSNPGN